MPKIGAILNLLPSMKNNRVLKLDKLPQKVLYLNHLKPSANNFKGMLMARPLRITFPGAFYHVTSRGNERKAVFKSKR